MVHRRVLAERHRGAARPGRLGALRGQCLWSVPLSGPDKGQKTRYFFQEFGRIRAVAAAPDGSLWIGTSNRDGRGTPDGTDDKILRIVF